MSSLALASQISPADLEADRRLIEMWLHGRPLSTQRTYRATIKPFLGAIATLKTVTLEEAQAYTSSLSDKSSATQAHAIRVLKSLFRYAHETGYLPFNVAIPLKSPKIKDTLAERILEPVEVLRLIDAVKQSPRNHLMLYLTYASGCRVDELVGLKWRDAKRRSDGGQITIFGKGGKTRTVNLPAKVWRSLSQHQPDPCSLDDPIFVSRKGGHITPRQVQRIVKQAAEKAGLSPEISPHWLRHAHASHAMDAGSPMHVVQKTLGHTSPATTGRYLHVRPTESSSKYLPL
ncbi:MAG: tyrosine-type recombinase/integrase [Drouetiella hepatica Uher 2000/2452]|uniref:Tyrosine-type recombinase/integrase n=1 Tax=Drouetiella hepatica Uher 2000/2452 TaxID=904376 RepID=A0A951QFH4_9CYAN|nr:tyrosine-type recombinase/integrase [Drouetiella hepatica Uher 2000/2452]